MKRSIFGRAKATARDHKLLKDQIPFYTNLRLLDYYKITPIDIQKILKNRWDTSNSLYLYNGCYVLLFVREYVTSPDKKPTPIQSIKFGYLRYRPISTTRYEENRAITEVADTFDLHENDSCNSKVVYTITRSNFRDVIGATRINWQAMTADTWEFNYAHRAFKRKRKKKTKSNEPNARNITLHL